MTTEKFLLQAGTLHTTMANLCEELRLLAASGVGPNTRTVVIGAADAVRAGRVLLGVALDVALLGGDFTA